jgi:hypothetical protein
MYEAGLIEGEREVTESSNRVIRVYPMRLTWAGHDFLAAGRNDTVWQKAKAKIVSKLGDAPVEIFKEVLMQSACTYLRS